MDICSIPRDQEINALKEIFAQIVSILIKLIIPVFISVQMIPMLTTKDMCALILARLLMCY